MADVFADCPELGAFLQREPAATIAVPIDEQDTIHAASLLYWHSTDPLVFYFVTGKQTEKCRLLNKKQSLPAACVVGTYRGTDFSLQMRGTLTILDKTQHQAEIDQYYAKRADRHDDVDDPDTLLLGFTPTWARYTDYTESYDRRVLDLGKQEHES